MDLASLKIIIDARGAEAGSRRATRAMNRMKRSSDGVTKSLSAMQKVFYSLGISVAIEVARRYADAWTSAANKLKVFIQNANDLVDTQHRLYEISNKTWQSYDASVTLFNKMLLVQKPLNATMEDMYTVTEAVGKAVSLSGATAATASGALLQLGQALSSGRVYAEEFNSIIEGTPRLAIAVAEGLGYASVGILKKAIQDGKVTSEQLFGAIKGQADKLTEEFGRTSLTTSAGFQILGNALQKLIGEFDTSTGITSALSKAIVGLAENLELVAKALVGIAGVFVAAKLAAIANAVITLTLRAKALIPALNGMTAAMVAANIAAVRLATGIALLNKAITGSALFRFGGFALRFAAFLGGPLVAAIALVASGAAAAASSIDHLGIAFDIVAEKWNEFWSPWQDLPAAMGTVLKEVIEYLTGWDLDPFFKKFWEGVDTFNSIWKGAIKIAKEDWNDFINYITPEEYTRRVRRKLAESGRRSALANALGGGSKNETGTNSTVEDAAAKAKEKLKTEYADFTRTLEETINPLTEYEKGLELLNRAQKAGAITADQYASSLERLKQAYAGERIGALIREGKVSTSAEILKGIDIDAQDNYNSPIPRLVTEGQEVREEELRTRDSINEQAKSSIANLQREVQFKRELLSANREDRDILRQKFELEERLLGLEGYTEEQIQSIRDATEESNRLTSILTEQERIADQFKNVWDSAFDRFTDGLLKGKAEFSDFVEHLATELLRIQIQNNLIGPLSNALTSFAGSVFGGGGAGGGSGPSYSYQHFTPNPHTRATGGPVTGGTPYLVGERGPEMFVPNSSGRVVSNDRLKGNTTVNVNVNNTASDSVRVETYQESEGEIFLEIVKDDAEGGRLGRQINSVTGTARQGV